MLETSRGDSEWAVRRVSLKFEKKGLLLRWEVSGYGWYAKP